MALFFRKVTWLNILWKYNIQRFQFSSAERLFVFSWSFTTRFFNGITFDLIYTYLVHMISFQTFFVWAFKIVVDSWNTSYVMLYILWDDWTHFYYFRFKRTATAAIGIHPTKVWLSLLVNFKNAIWRWGRTICNKFCFKLGKNTTETYGMLQTAFRPSCTNRESVLSGIRDSRKAGSLWGMMRGVGGVRKSEHQSWLAEGLGLGLLCWGF